jgi:hypothetical protein
MTIHPWMDDPEKERGQLYVIEHPNSYQKIGVSSSLRRRLTDLQAGSPYELQVRTTIASINPQTTESYLHEELNPHRVRGEWFDLPGRILERLDELPMLGPVSVGFQLEPVLEDVSHVKAKRANRNAAESDPGSRGSTGDQVDITGWWTHDTI